jgi:hypothetical protein
MLLWATETTSQRANRFAVKAGAATYLITCKSAAIADGVA